MERPGVHSSIRQGEASLKVTFHVDASATDLSALEFSKKTVSHTRTPQVLDPRQIAFLRSDPAQVGADFEIYSGPLTINFTSFQKMVPGTGIPDLSILDQVRTPDAKTNIDTHFGVMDKPNVRVLLMLSEYMRPQNTLMIGTGRGLVDALLAQTMPDSSRLDTVDPGLKRVQDSITIVPVSASNQRYIRYTAESDVGAYIREAEDKQLIPRDRVRMYAVDSTEFFSQRAQEFRVAEPASRDKLKYDLIIIDGNHTYPQPEIDINYALGFLREGGVLFIDDWQKLATNSGVTGTGLEISHKLGRYIYHVGDINDPKDYQTGCVFMINSPLAIRPALRQEVQRAINEAEEFRKQFFGT